jgi:PAS domain S-box-containing protein
VATTPEVKSQAFALAPDDNHRADHFLAGRIALIYALVSVVWILGSDRLASSLAEDRAREERLQSWKGLGFVLVSAAGLHWLTYRSLRQGRMHERERRFFAHLAANARDAVFALDPADDFRVLYLNTTAVTALGTGGGELLGKPVWEVSPELSREVCGRAWQQLEAGEQPNLLLRIPNPDGSPRVAETSLEVLAIGPRRLLSGRAWDITERAAHEERQRQLLAQLTESQARLAEQQAQLVQSRSELELFNQLSLTFLTRSDPRAIFQELESAIATAFGAQVARVALAPKPGELVFPASGAGESSPLSPTELRHFLGSMGAPGTGQPTTGVSPSPSSPEGAGESLAAAIRQGDELLGGIWLSLAPARPDANAGSRLERLAQHLAPALRAYLAESRFKAQQENTLAVALANEAKFTAIFHNSLDALFLVEAQSGLITDCNRQAAELFADGDRNRLIGLEGRLLALAPRSPEAAKDLRMRIAEGFDYEGEFEYRSLGGRVFWGHVAGEHLAMPGTQLQLFRLLDISQRKADEQKLAEQARFRQELIDSVPLPVFVKDTAGHYLECNRALAEFIGLPREQLIGKTVADVFPDEFAIQYRRRDDELFLHQGRQVYRGTVRNAAGSLRSVIFHRATFHQVDGSLGGLIGTFIDVTEFDGAMSQLRLQESALNAAANGIAITDRNGIALWANPACERLTGYRVEEIVNSSLRILKSDQQQEQSYSNLWQTIMAGQVWQGELLNRRKDGTTYHEEMTITPLKDEQGNVTNFVAIKQDISSRKQVEMQYLRAQRMEGIGLLASGIAHDLNNVLAPVLLSIELLQAMHPDADTQDILHTVEQSARRGADIVRQVLTFARGVKGERIPLQSKHLVKDIMRVAKETFPKNIEVHIRMDTEVSNVEGDPTQIHQVLLNLAVNARDAMPDGGRLTLSAHNHSLAEAMPAVNGTIPPGDYVVLGVKDTGIGIEQENLSRLFEPFFTTKAANKGTGLGLPTALGIVKSHSGFFRVVTEPGKGAEFLVYLPVCNRDESRPASPPHSAPRGNGETILVVDDELGIRSLASEILSRHGYRVLIASDGTDAMALVAQHRSKVELVLTDVMMPHMDGVALTRSLRKLAPHTRVLAFSGLSGGASLASKIEELRSLGVPPVLSKPLTAPELLNAVHDLLYANPQS